MPHNHLSCFADRAIASYGYDFLMVILDSAPDEFGNMARSLAENIRISDPLFVHNILRFAEEPLGIASSRNGIDDKVVVIHTPSGSEEIHGNSYDSIKWAKCTAHMC